MGYGRMKGPERLWVWILGIALKVLYLRHWGTSYAGSGWLVWVVDGDVVYAV
jgi:hypothetical protein